MQTLQTKFVPVPFSCVTVTDGWCANALRREIAYLLALDEQRLLCGFYENAGLTPPAPRYGGWEDSPIAGHTLGHYLAALSQAFANPAVPAADREQIAAKIGRICDAIALCQAHSQGEEGFVWGALPVAGGAEAQFDNVEAGKTNITTQAWVPWYTMHKIIAGLEAAYELAGNGRALEVARRLGDWVCRRTARWSEAVQRQVLSVEYGGMNDCLYTLFALTGEARYAEAAHRFDEEEFFSVVLSGVKDGLKDRHANTAIPKILGALNRYRTLHGRGGADESRYLHVAEAFWETVVRRHTYVTGGNSEWEHFGPDYVLDAERTNCNCETCNAYNMLKLSRGLFALTGDKKYTDFYENTFVNSILSSQNPETGMTTYFQPMASGFFKVYGDPFDKFWCCTGSGMESFTKLGEGAYYADGNNICVELYLSSRLAVQGTLLEQTCGLPESGESTFRVLAAERPFYLLFRLPDWAVRGFAVTKNGGPLRVAAENGHLRVLVRAGDTVRLEFPCCVTLAPLPDNADSYAFRYGPAVLSADLGREDMQTATTGVCVTIPAKKRVATERVYLKDKSAFLADPDAFFVREGEAFRLTGGDIPLTFGFHYRRYRERYGIYWYLLDGERVPEAQETREVIDTVQPGYGQYENDALHAMREQGTVSVTDSGTCRYAQPGGWFAYDMAVDAGRRNVLLLRLRAADNGKPLQVCAGGETLLEERLLYTQGEEEYVREVALPAELIFRAAHAKGGRTVIEVRFAGNAEEESARVCEFIRIAAE